MGVSTAQPKSRSASLARHGHPGHVVGALASVGFGTVRAEGGVAPGRELRQREGIRDSPAGGVEPLPVHARGGHLRIEQGGQVARVQGVPNLFALPAETDVAQWLPAQMGVDPVREDALVGRAELAGAGQDSAAVDPNREAEGCAPLQRQGLGGQLGAAIEGDRRAGGEVAANASGGDPARKGLRYVQLEGVAGGRGAEATGGPEWSRPGCY